MKDSDSKNTGDTAGPDTGAATPNGQRADPAPDAGTGHADSDRPSAIERQRAAVEAAAALGLADQEMSRPKRGSRIKLALGAILALWLIALSLGYVFTEFRTAVMETVSRTEHALVQFTQTPQKTTAPSQPAEAKAAIDTTNAITVPIDDVSLRVRPELLQQLVQVYRLRLITDPNDPTATTTLARLRERSLSELEVISATENAPLVATSFNMASKLFPELAGDQRYQSLAARANRSKPAAETETAINAAQPKPAATDPPDQPVASITPESTTTAQQAEPAQPAARAPNAAPTISPSTKSSPAAATKTAEAAMPSKPEIRVISLTPGTLVENRFVPGQGGNVFMLAINYRNVGSSADIRSGAELVVRLGSGRDPQVLAEATVEIAGSRGTKSFLMGALVPGYSGEIYKLNFILDGHLLPSRTVRLTLAADTDARP